jgi:hypothetical protein
VARLSTDPRILRTSRFGFTRHPAELIQFQIGLCFVRHE